jgi:DNA (cytosine-5)-methyltransferase 1
MSGPRALDLFCKAGGASMGLHRAGFDVVGVDIEPQPHYPFTFVQGDALNPPFRLSDFDFIWASPVCKRYTDGAAARMAKGAKYPDQIPATRALLASHPMTVIENVMKAPIRPDIVLHGHMFDLKVIRRRKFECSWPAFSLLPPLPRGLLREGFVCMVGNGTPTGVREMGLPHYTAEQCREASGIDWMNRGELSQAIPPAYAEFIGRASLEFIHKKSALAMESAE